MIAKAVGVPRRRARVRSVLRRAGNPVAANVTNGVQRIARRARWRHRVRRRQRARCRQGHRVDGRPDAADLGFRGSRRLVDARGRRRHGADDRRCRRRPAPARKSGAPLSSPIARSHQEDHLSSADDAGIVIADPELTVGLPPKITAATGMDALSHCLEAYCAPFHHPLADGIALEGMRLIKEWLPVAVADGSNIEARSHMLVASAMGATAFQKGLGAMHSLSHPCSANLNTHHGLTNAVVMPYVLAWNRSAIEEKMTRLAAYLGPAAAFVRRGARVDPGVARTDRHSRHARRSRHGACARVGFRAAGVRRPLDRRQPAAHDAAEVRRAVSELYRG